MSDAAIAVPPHAESDVIKLNLSGLRRIYLATWPYIFPQLRHFLALLALNLGLVGFGTAVAFLGVDILWDSVGRSEPLSQAQAKVMMLPSTDFVDVDSLSEAARLEILWRFLIVSAVIIVLTTSMFTVIAMYKVWILQRVNQDLRVAMVRNAEELSLRFHAKMSAGDGIYRVFQDSAMVTAVVDNIVVQPIIAIAILVMQLCIASLFSPWFSFLLFFAVALSIVLTAWFTRRIRDESIAARRANAGLFTRVQETFQCIQTIKAYGYESGNQAKFQAASRNALDTAFLLRRDFATLKVFVSFLLAATLFATDYIATQFVLDNQPVLGASLLVLFGMSLTHWTVAAHQARRGTIDAVTANFESLIKLWCFAQDMAVGLGRAFWLLAQEPEVRDPVDPQPMPVVERGVRFEGVTFGYDSENPVLNQFELVGRTGEITALVGTSGAGKSTAMSLLLRLFDPDAGHVLIDDINVRSVLVSDLRKNVAIALQENVLFPVTIAENLRYAMPGASDSAIEKAAQLACAHEFISGLPEGYQTELGEGGALLSVGQKQRISIARALVRDARILILDEPTASLDTETERQVMANLKTWAKDRVRVVFLITHRLSTIRDADQIAFLSEGRIAETGTHDELIARQGAYANFVSSSETSDA